METYTIEVEDKKCVISKPDRKVMGLVLPKLFPMLGDEKQDMLGAGEIILKTCWVSGDEEIRTVDEYILAASLQCVSLIEMKTASIKKN
tara:strand:+ start:209 stop:475 length:267 start_codon:yes stop_codon:yes gene_type:complete